jgi:hypothetical protein
MPRTPQPPSLESKSLRFGKKDPMVMACSEKIFPWKIIGVMVQMMEVRFEIRKTLFFGTINPEKMVNLIIYLKIHQMTPHLPNIPCDDSSTSTAGYLTLR